MDRNACIARHTYLPSQCTVPFSVRYQPGTGMFHAGSREWRKPETSVNQSEILTVGTSVSCGAHSGANLIAPITHVVEHRFFPT
jgi:hypothetical protein